MLARQEATTGLLLSASSHTAHLDWLRANVRAGLAIWAMLLAYRRCNGSPERQQVLEQRLGQLLRGLLRTLWQRCGGTDSGHPLSPALPAWPARYRSGTTADTDPPAVACLQSDAIPLLLFWLSQWLAAGLPLTLAAEEIAIVHYLASGLSRRVQRPDFGNGPPGTGAGGTLPLDTVALTWAALTVLPACAPDGQNPAHSIQVLPDDLARAEDTLTALLHDSPVNRETAPALLQLGLLPTERIMMNNAQPAQDWRVAIQRLFPPLASPSLEPAGPRERSPGPLLLAWLLLDAALVGDTAAVPAYRTLLEPALTPPVRRAGTSERLPDGSLWLEVVSLYLLAGLLADGYLDRAALLPLPRREPAAAAWTGPLSLAVLAETEAVRQRLATHGIVAQTLAQLPAAVRVRPATHLAAIRQLGEQPPVAALPDWPPPRLGSLATSHPFTATDGTRVVFLPPYCDSASGYLNLDNRLLTAQLERECDHLRRHWRHSTAPLVTLLISDAMLQTGGYGRLLNLLQTWQSDSATSGVRLAPLTDWLATLPGEPLPAPLPPPVASLTAPQPVALLPTWRKLAARPLSVAHAVALRQETDPNQWLRQLVASANPYEQIELLTLLWERLGAEFVTPQGVNLRQLTEAVYLQAGTARLWSVLRRAGGLLDRADGELATAVATLLARGYRVSVGRGYSDQAIIARPLASAEIMQRLRAYGGDDPRCRALLQEIVLLLGRWQQTEPAATTGKPLLRPWQLLLRMTGSLARDWGITRGEACEVLLRLSPYTLLNRLRQVLPAGGADDDDQARVRLDGLRYQGELPGLLRLHVPATGGLTLIGDELWSTWRQVHGTLLHLPEDFAEQLRVLLAHCRGLVIGDQLDPRNRLDSQPLLAEPPLAAALEQQVMLLLQAIRGPAYRQLTLEALLALTDLFRNCPDLQVDDYLVLDVLIGTAVRLTWEQAQPPDSAAGYADCCADAWNTFYANPPHRVARAVLAALGVLLEAPARVAGEG